MAVGGPGAAIVSILSGRVVANLLISSADLLTAFGAGAKLYLERDTTSAFAAPTVVTSTTIVSGTEQIEFTDTSGTTSSWYRVRVGNSGGTTYGDYSTGVQATSLLAYASIDDTIETMSIASSDTKALNLIGDLLIDAAALLNKVCGRDFYRHPQVSGTEVRYYHVIRAGQRSFRAATGESIDIISVTTLRLADSTNGSYTAISAGATGYWLEPQNPINSEPFTDILLSSNSSSYSFFPAGERIVELTLAGGWSSPPGIAHRANIDLAREWYRQGPGGGGPVGISALGQPIFGPGTPPSVVELYKRYGVQRGQAYVG